MVVQDTVDAIYKNCEKEDLREARHKVGCHTIDRRVLQCKTCKVKERPTDVISNALHTLKSKLSGDVPIPLPPGLLDIAAYRFVYDVDLGNGQNDCNLEDGRNKHFWSDRQTRDILLRLRFDEHFYLHARSCFKKGCECRFFFPYRSRPKKTELFSNLSKKAILFYTLDGETHERTGFVVELRRPQGWQFTNAHSDPVSSIGTCNTNVQTGDMAQAFLSDLVRH